MECRKMALVNYLWGRNREADAENGTVEQQEKEEEEWIEREGLTYIHVFVKQIAGDKLL